MSDVPSDLKYTKSHEWIRVEGDEATIGITDHAQDQLGDMVFVEVPEVGAAFDVGDACAVVESVKAASDVYSPLTGEVIESNEALADSPESVNQDAYGDGWIMKLKLSDPEELEELLDADAYAEFCENEDH